MDSIFLVATYIIHLISNMFYVLLRSFRMFLPLFIVIIIYTIAKIIYRCSKYGYKSFNVFKKRNSINYKQELLFFMLTKLNGYRKIITLKKLNSHIVVIDETGIYLLQIFDYDGLVYGEVNENYLLKKMIDHEPLKINNPFPMIEKDKDMLLKTLGPINIYKYIIVNNACILDTKYYGDTKVVYFKDFYHKIELPLKNNKKIYSKNDINKYCKVLTNDVK